MRRPLRLLLPGLLLLAGLLFATGCKSTGSQEYIPGKGWRLIR